MKLFHTFTASLFVFVFASCNTEEIDDFSASSLDNSAARQVHKKRSINEALSEVERALDLFAHSLSSTRNIQRRRAVDGHVQCFVRPGNTRSANLNDTLYYAFNFANNEGYALISADATQPALLAITEEGHYDINLPGGVCSYINELILSSMNRVMPPVNPDLPSLFEHKETRGEYHYTVAPRLQVKWGGGYPFGDDFPNQNAGCGNVAIVQALSYFNFPTGINVPYNGIGNILLNWTEMKKHVKSNHTSQEIHLCPANSASHDNLKYLTRTIGIITSSESLPNGQTKTSDTKIKNALGNLGLTCSDWEDYENNTCTAIGSNGLVLVTGKSANNTGHAWLIDGYQLTQVRDTFWTRRISELNWNIKKTSISNTYYNHINWGWDGYNNGYFASSIFRPTDYISLDYNESSNAYYNEDFSNSVKFITIHH